MARRSKREGTEKQGSAAPLASPAVPDAGVDVDVSLESDVSSASNSQDASRLISLRVPLQMLEDLRRHARRRAMPYQSLLKHWLAERLEEESERLEQHRSAVSQGREAKDK